MIRKIRRKLVWSYTLAIIAILLISSLAGGLALNYFTNLALENTLIPELESEVEESRPFLRAWLDDVDRKPRMIYFDYHEMAFIVMEYWFSTEGEVVMIEGSQKISALLLKHLQQWDHPNMEIGELKFFDTSGKMLTFILIADNVFDVDGTYLGKVIVGINITPLVHINRRYIQASIIIIIVVSMLAFLIGNYFAAKAIEPIDVTMQKQRNFVADASHELRTPLSVMLASVDLLTPLESNRQITDDIRSEIINMRNLVNSLLLLARSESDKDESDFSHFDLSKVAQNMVSSLQHLANAKNIKLVHDFEPGIILYGDAIKIRQLFNILLDNAIKYSLDNMAVLFNIKRRHSQVIITVQDYGVGIAKEDLINIFERFYRADKARSRAQSSFGLGLSIARQIAERHGGEIKVESELGRGSVFTVSIPLEANAAKRPKPHSAGG